jgi:hypothetical protein
VKVGHCDSEGMDYVFGIVPQNGAAQFGRTLSLFVKKDGRNQKHVDFQRFGRYAEYSHIGTHVPEILRWS